jgi:hypothetical protein
MKRCLFGGKPRDREGERERTYRAITVGFRHFDLPLQRGSTAYDALWQTQVPRATQGRLDLYYDRDPRWFGRS